MKHVATAVLEQTLSKGAESLEKSGRESIAYLVPVTGRIGDPLPAESERLMNMLENHGVPYRLFSRDNTAMQWAAFDQAGSLLDCGGGVPFQLMVPNIESLQPLYFLGVDLGHPMDVRKSWVVVSLVDSTGCHVRSWRCRQARDETVRVAVLTRALRWVREQLAKLGHPRAQLIVLRDGRLHRGEEVRFYREHLPGQLSFVEVAKYGNPVMFCDDATQGIAPPGSVGCSQDPVVAFITPVKANTKDQLPRTMKIHMRTDWDGLSLGMKNVCEILAGLSYSPGLGLRPHFLPGPLYWADGIAAIGPTNHQFSGQRYDEPDVQSE